ncbi:MAG: hypothetical protein ACON38_10620 [Akkermansiaceae bacterium]
MKPTKKSWVRSWASASRHPSRRRNEYTGPQYRWHNSSRASPPSGLLARSSKVQRVV